MAPVIQIKRGTRAQLNAAASAAALKAGEPYLVTDENSLAVGLTTTTYADVAGVTATQTLTNKTLTDPVIVGAIQEDVYTITDGAAFEIDPGNGSIQLVTLGANRTPKATHFAAGESVLLMVDDQNAYALTWTDTTMGGSGVRWTNVTAPTFPDGANNYQVIELWKVGTQVYGAAIGVV